MLAERAKAYIRSHGWEAFDTLDGVVAISPLGYDPEQHGVEADDRWCEEAMVFPVHFEPSPKDGFAIAHVDGRAVRHWLGY